MDGLISVESKMTYEDMKRYLWFHLLKRGRGIRPSFIVMIVAMAVLVLVLFSDVLMFGVSSLSDIWLPLVAVLAFLALYFSIIPLMARRVYKTSKTHFESGQRFTFGPDGVTIETKGESVSGTGTYRYDAFHKAFETKDAFYLYISAQQAHLVSKRGMQEDTAAGIRGLLGEKLGKKFVSCI